MSGVLFVGKRWLEQIRKIKITNVYCQMLLQNFGVCHIHNYSEKSHDSIDDTVNKTFQTMAIRLQEVYNAVYQPVGMGDIVYSLPGPSRILQCIKKLDDKLNRGENKVGFIANSQIRIKNGINILLLNARYLEVYRSNGVIIQVIRNPGIASNNRLTASTMNNMLWHLDELVDVRYEEMAWRQTMQMAA